MRRGSTLLLLSRSLRLASGESELSLAPGWQPELPFAKKVVFIRHAEGIHNRDAKEIPNYFADKLGYGMTYWDAELTPTGREQCALLSKVLPEQAGVLDLVAVSPLTRTLRTAALAFPNASSRPPFFATSLARERIALHTCDGRRRRSELQSEFPWVDFSEITSEEDEMWDDKETEVEMTSPGGEVFKHSAKCAARGVELLRWLHRRPEQHIAVVSHWVFLLHLFRPFTQYPELQSRFGNAEARVTTLHRRTAEHDEL